MTKVSSSGTLAHWLTLPGEFERLLGRIGSEACRLVHEEVICAQGAEEVDVALELLEALYWQAREDAGLGTH